MSYNSFVYGSGWYVVGFVVGVAEFSYRELLGQSASSDLGARLGQIYFRFMPKTAGCNVVSMADDYNSMRKRLEYNDLKVKAIEHLDIYLHKGNSELESLKDRFYDLVPERKRKKVTTVKELLQTLEDSNVIHIDNVLILRDLARLLELKDLQDIIDEYDLNHCAGYKKVFKVLKKLPGKAYRTAAVCLKTIISSSTFVKVTAVSGLLLTVLHNTPEALESIQKVLPLAIKLLGVREGSISFIVKSSSLSALKELWSCYKDGSLQENIRKVLNGIKEVREVFNGEEIDVEVTIDEDEYRDACWDAVLLQMADRYKPTEESSSVGREHRHSSCDMDLPRTTMTGLAWSDWIKVREIYNESKIESNKRRKAEKKVAELVRELHILENEKQPLVSERIAELQSELQRIQHEREEVNRENVSLKNKFDEATSKLLADQEFLSNQLDPLWKTKPEELLELFQQLTTDLIGIVSNTELNVDVLIKVMQEIVKVLGRAPWHRLDGSTKISSIVTMMTLVTERAVNHPDLKTDELIQVMQENTKVLEELRWYQLDEESKMKLISSIETMTTWVAVQLAKHPDLSTDELIRIMQENTKVLEKLPWGYLNVVIEMKLTSSIETMTTWVAEQLVKHPDLSTDVLIQVMQENTKVLEKLPWENIDDGIKNRLTSDLQSMIKHVIQHLSKHPEISNDVFKGILCTSEAILKKISLFSWTNLNSDSQNHVLSCLAELMKLVSERAIYRGEREVLSDAVSIILAMSSLLPESSDITSRLQSHLEAMVDSVEKGSALGSYSLSIEAMIPMMTAALNKLKPGNKLSSEALMVILSIVSRITKDELVRIWWYSGVWDHFMSHLQDVRRFLPEDLPAASDVTELKSQVDSHVDTLDRVLLQFNDIQMKGTESDQPFILDEVVSGIKEELSKLKKELANMIRVFERKTKHGLEFKDSIQALIERLEVEKRGGLFDIPDDSDDESMWPVSRLKESRRLKEEERTRLQVTQPPEQRSKLSDCRLM